MSPLLISLASTLGKSVADLVFNKLNAQKDGDERLKNATKAIASGATAIEALRQAFGKDFLTVLNEVLGSSNASFTYEAGIQHYIRQESGGLSPAQMLRDELNINLERLTLLKLKGKDLKNQALGTTCIWGRRCLEMYDDTKNDDIQSTLKAMNELLTGDSRNYRQLYELMATTTLGSTGALMVIAGVLTATGTGAGIIAAISALFLGIPWITVGALVIPGALLVLLAAKKARPVDEISLTVALAYKLLDRLGN